MDSNNQYQITDKELRDKFEKAVPNMIVGDADLCVQIAKEYAATKSNDPELLSLLAEAKEVLIQLDHRHNGKCYNPGATDCDCTLCKIEKSLNKTV